MEVGALARGTDASSWAPRCSSGPANRSSPLESCSSSICSRQVSHRSLPRLRSIRSAPSRILLFISGALSIALGVFALRDYDDGAAVWLLALWIGVGFMFQGVSETVLAISFKELPERGWYIFVGVLTMIAGVVMLAWPISSIVVLSIIAGLWLVVIGTTEIVWAVNVRSEAKKVQRGVESLSARRGRLTHQSAC